MKRNEPSLDWLASPQIQEVNGQMWVKDSQRAVLLEEGWELICPASDLTLPERKRREGNPPLPDNDTNAEAFSGEQEGCPLPTIETEQTAETKQTVLDMEKNTGSAEAAGEDFRGPETKPEASQSNETGFAAENRTAAGFPAETDADPVHAESAFESRFLSGLKKQDGARTGLEQETSWQQKAARQDQTASSSSKTKKTSQQEAGHFHLRCHHIHSILPDQEYNGKRMDPELQERIVSLPFYKEGKFANIQQTIQNTRSLTGHDTIVSYPWDGLEMIKTGDVPENQTGFWLLHSFDAGEHRSWQLALDGVLGAVYVYINDQFAGFAKSTSQSLAFDLTGFIEAGENVISLLVFPYSSASWLCFGLEKDRYGIGQVWMQPVEGPAFLKALEVRSEVSPNLEEARIWIELPQEESVWMHVMLDDPQKQRVLDFESRSPLLALDLVDILLWSMECPNLYTLQIEWFNEKKERIRWFEKKIGLRLLEQRHGIWMLNGKKLLLKGLYLSDFFFHENPDWEEAFRLWKKEQVNAVYIRQTPGKGVLELADFYGIGIISDADLHTGLFHGVRQGFERLWKKESGWKLSRQMELLTDHCSVLALCHHRTVFPEDFEFELYRPFQEQNHFFMIPQTKDDSSCWFPFKTLPQAERILAEHWDHTVLMSGDLRMEEWETLQQTINFGGFFLMDQHHPWNRIKWSLRVQDFYTPWRLFFEKRGIRVENRNQFISGRGHLLSWIVWKDGHTPAFGSRELDVPAGTIKRYFLNDGWDLSHKVSATVEQIEPTAFAPAAFVESSREWDQWRPAALPSTMPLEGVFGEHCSTIQGKDFHVRFDAYGLVSLQCHQQEMLAGRPEVVLFAPDQKSLADRIWLSVWQLADRPRIHRDFENGLGGIVRFDYILPTMPQSRCSVSYSIAPSGLIGVDIALKCSSELPDLPYFGWSLPLRDPTALRVQNEQHLLRLPKNVPDHLLNVEYAQAIWPGSRITLCQIDRPLQIWITPGSFSQMRSGLVSGQEPVWLSAAPDPIAYEPSLLENDAYKRIQFSLLLDLRKAQY